MKYGDKSFLPDSDNMNIEISFICIALSTVSFQNSFTDSLHLNGFMKNLNECHLNVTVYIKNGFTNNLH